ncbi:MAG: hypothetical protein K6G49_01075 [Candidatus Saccharibacteria bacterium]|nr:hypothetical protein [Candidatus Saccharibacteria bacterium]
MAKRRNYRKIIWWTVGVILVAGIVIAGIVIGINNTGRTNNDEMTKTEEQPKVEQKDDNDNKNTEEENTEEIDDYKKITQYEGADPNKAEELSGVVTYASVNGGTLVIRTSIDQYLTEGTCDLTLERDGHIIYSDTTNIVGEASTATCQGFDVTTAGLGEGKIDIIINLNANSKSGVIRGGVDI